MKKITIIAVAAVLAVGAAGCYSASDVTQACAERGGVQSFESSMWDMSNNYDGIAICKDGTAVGID